MKKKVSVFFLVLIFLVTSINISANAYSIDDILRAKGIPSKNINVMPECMKEYISNRDIVFNSWGKVEKPKVIAMTSILGASDIPDDEFDLYIGIYDAPDSKDGRKRKEVFVYFNWTRIPTWWQKDPFAVSWDSDWKPVADTDFHCDEAIYFNNTIGGDDIILYNEDNTLEASEPTGVGWIADLKSLIRTSLSTKSLGGFGTITIEEKASGKATSNNVYAKYGHDITPLFTPSISIYGIGIDIKNVDYIRATMEDFDL